MSDAVKLLRSKGYPLKIDLDGRGHEGVLCDIQPLLDGDYQAIYRGDRGEITLGLTEINLHYDVIER